MAATYSSWTGIIPSEWASKVSLTNEEISQVFDDGPFSPRQSDFNVHKCLVGSFRNGWTLYSLDALLSKSNTPSLDFLTSALEAPHEALLILPVTQLAGLAEALESFLAWCKANPSLVNEQLAECSEEELLEAMSNPTLSNHPGGSDAEGERCFFSYLRSLLLILRQALSTNRPVLHSTFFE